MNICLLNTRSLRLHTIDIQKDKFLYKNDLLCLTETQMSYENSDEDTQNIREQLSNYILSHNIDQHKFNSITVCHPPLFLDITEYDHSSCFSLVKFRKKEFSDKEFSVLVLYNSSKIHREVFAYTLAQFIERHVIDIILGDFNTDGFELDKREQLLVEVLSNYTLMTRFPTHVDGKMLDHVWVQKELSIHYDIQVIRKCVNLSDHDAVKISLSKK